MFSELLKKCKLLYIIILILLIYNSIQAQTLTNAVHAFTLTYDLKLPGDREFRISDEEEKLFIPEFNVKGIYVTGWAAGSKEKMDKLINLVDDTIINTMVIDIKDTTGHISYNSSVKLAKEIGANRSKIRDIRSLIKRLHDKNIYVIGRIATFKDAKLAKNKPELALQLYDKENKKEITSQAWVNPAREEVWNYNLNLAKEAYSIGFNEVQYDYIRYPALASKPIQVIMQKGTYKSQVINGFAKYVKENMKSMEIPLSIDVFGLTTSVNNDLGIGQNFKELSNIINIISPMIYPSHYAEGSYGIEIPDREPYQIIYKSLYDARKKTIDNKNVNIRPWLQDFSMGHKYSKNEILKQIKAVEILGIEEWLLWNPSSRYTKEALINPSLE